jgi:chromosome segregation ATPase
MNNSELLKLIQVLGRDLAQEVRGRDKQLDELRSKHNELRQDYEELRDVVVVLKEKSEELRLDFADIDRS